MRLFPEFQHVPGCIPVDRGRTIFAVLDASDYGKTPDDAEREVLLKYPDADIRNYFASDFWDAMKAFKGETKGNLEANPEYQVVSKWAKATGRSGGLIEFNTVRYNHPTRGAIERTFETVISAMRTNGYNSEFELEVSGGSTGNVFNIEDCKYVEQEADMWR